MVRAFAVSSILLLVTCSPPASSRAERRGGRPADAKVLLAEHNRYRAAHCARPLTWSPKLAKAAQTWANRLRASGCAFEHSRTKYGENLAAGTSSVLPAKRAVAMWYDEIKQYRFPDGGFSLKTGHFTQVVWAGTRQLGCGSATCNGMTIWVCNYDPPGNVTGGYRANVKRKSCKK